ncbi:MAG TPA: PQQ-binding-like beta-propeller repeat protein [Planctomycetaceae bacterium]|nr:PQQ-binding-like beta-propeller repeat protein [Planctomycetaceae bacterium]
MFGRFTLLVALACWGWCAVSLAAEPIGWRRDGSGTFPNTDPPLHWSTTQNVRWSTEMPGRSNSQPVPAGNRLFVCADPDWLVCVDADNGKVLWQHRNTDSDAVGEELWARVEQEREHADDLQRKRDTLELRRQELSKQIKQQPDAMELRDERKAVAAKIEALETELKSLTLVARFPKLKTHEITGYTTATPTTDGRHVWAIFGNSVVVCYDLDGHRQWIKKLPDFPNSEWGHSTSPLLVGDTLIVIVDAIVGLDAHTGEERWRTRFGQSWGSPVHVRVDGVDLIVTANGKVLRVSDGKMLGRGIPLANVSPLIDGRRIYSIQSDGAAHELPEHIGDSIMLTELWKTAPKGKNHYASPVLRDGIIFTVSSNSVLTLIDAADGSILSERRLDLGPGTTYPSLAIAGRMLFVSSDNGTTLVLSADRDCRELAHNTLEPFVSTPVFYGRRMYVRTHNRLWCIETEKEEDAAKR